MIAVDTNVLVAAHRRDSDRHEMAFAAMRHLAQSADSWAIPYACLHEFLVVATHPRIFDPPTTLDAAIRQVELWGESPPIVFLAEHAGHWASLRRLLVDGAVRGPRIHDARIAAICLAHGVTELWTADRDFGRFPQLRTHNPLVG